MGARIRVPIERYMQTYDGMSWWAITIRFTVFDPPQHAAARTRRTFPRRVAPIAPPPCPRSRVTITAPARIAAAATYPATDSRSLRNVNANTTVNIASVFDRRAALTGVVRLNPV